MWGERIYSGERGEKIPLGNYYIYSKYSPFEIKKLSFAVFILFFTPRFLILLFLAKIFFL